MRKPRALGMTFALVSMLAGCAPDPVMPTPPPDPTSTPVFASDEEALAAAEELYGEYIDASNRLGQGGWKEFSLVEPYLRGDALEDERETSAAFSNDGDVQVGSAAFDSMTLQRLQDDGRHVEITIYVCLDFSSTDVIDGQGVSVVSPDRVDRLALEVALNNFDEALKIERSEAWSGVSFC